MIDGWRVARSPASRHPRLAIPRRHLLAGHATCRNGPGSSDRRDLQQELAGAGREGKQVNLAGSSGARSAQVLGRHPDARVLSTESAACRVVPTMARRRGERGNRGGEPIYTITALSKGNVAGQHEASSAPADHNVNVARAITA